MANPQAGKFRPWLHLGIFGFLVVLLYGLVFFTPGSNAPRLGIDLQGGTRVTLSAATLDGSAPSAASMNQARTIMENRANGSGVSGAQVQIDGSRQLTVTVPGKTVNLTTLGRSAIMNIRPVIGQPTPDLTTAPATSATGTSSSVAPTTKSAVGETLSSPPPLQSDATPAASTSAAATTSAASQGLRAGVAASTPSGTTAAGTATTSAPAATSGSAPTAAATGTAAPTGTAAAPKAAAHKKGGTFPNGSDEQNPTQPQGTDATAWQAWETAAASSAQSGALICSDLTKYEGLDDPNKPLLACGEQGGLQYMYVLDKTLIPGDQISSADSGVDSQGGGYVVNVNFNSKGFSTWSSYTAGHVNTQTAFTLDGEVLSAPSIRQAIDTRTTQVSGSFTQAETVSLANSLNFGALPLHFNQDKTELVSAEVGLESLQAGLIAGGIGLLLVVIYCLVYYRLLGVITIASLFLSGIMIYAVMVLLGRWIQLSLDMPGIAGLIIAIGITADSFVVYFERLKDEVREGRTFRSAVPRGWERAKRTILSADAVTFLSAVILYLLAVGDVKGFAFTLGLSTVLDLVIVFLVTHPAVGLAADAKIFRSPRLSGLGAVAAAGQRHRAAASRFAVKEA